MHEEVEEPGTSGRWEKAEGTEGGGEGEGNKG